MKNFLIARARTITPIVLVFVATLMLISSARSLAAVDQTRAETRAYFPPVLIYHDIKPRVVMEGFDVALDEFRYQLDWLKSHGWRTLTSEDFLSTIERGEPFPKKSVLITFDDAYGGIIKYAAPELRARDMSAVFFVIVDSIDKTLSREYYHATTEQLKSLASESRFSLESHTLDHPRLIELSDEERRRQIADSKSFIEQLSGRTVKLFSYPYGDYDQSVIDDVIAADYGAAFIVDVLDGGLFERAARWSIPRLNMGLMVGASGHRWFSKFMRRYARTTDENFSDRWEQLPH